MSGCSGPSASQEGAVLDPSSLGVPGLKTLAAGARIEVLWQQGWEPGTVKECLLMMDTQPVIMYRVAYAHSLKETAMHVEPQDAITHAPLFPPSRRQRAPVREADDGLRVGPGGTTSRSRSTGWST